MDIEARLALFEQVCEAVRYAHRRLVIHRDLKPSNILVTENEDGAPQVKLLDFGIARLLDPELDETVTGTGSRPLTPAYAAPEQLRGEPITTAADVYALGVVLYELLAGRRPERPPKAPSFVVTQDSATARSATPERLSRRLRGDLDTIALKALREDQEERYPSVQLLLEDLKRYKGELPLHARPLTTGYRVRKFVKRHRAGVLIGAAFVVLLAVSVIAFALQHRQTVRERDRAEAAAVQTQQVTTFLAGLFSDADPKNMASDSLDATHLLARGVERVEEDLADQPEIQARMFHELAAIYYSMGQNAEAEPLFERALGIRRVQFGELHGEVAASLYSLASTRYLLGNTEGADSLFVQWEELAAALPRDETPEQAERLSFLANLNVHRGELDAAETYAREARGLRIQLFGEVHREAIASANMLAYIWVLQGMVTQAEALTREQLTLLEQLDEEEPKLRAVTLMNLARILSKTGSEHEAHDAFRESIELHSGLYGSTPTLVTMQLEFGKMLHEHGEYDEAEQTLREAETGFNELYGNDGFYSLHVRSCLGGVLRDQGEYEEAEALLEPTIITLTATRGQTDSYTQHAIKNIVSLYDAWGLPEEAARYRAMMVEEEEE